VNLPYLDAKTYEQVKPYLPLARHWELLAQLAPPGATASTSLMAPRTEIAEH